MPCGVNKRPGSPWSSTATPSRIPLGSPVMSPDFQLCPIQQRVMPHQCVSLPARTCGLETGSRLGRRDHPTSRSRCSSRGEKVPLPVDRLPSSVGRGPPTSRRLERLAIGIRVSGYWGRVVRFSNRLRGRRSPAASPSSASRFKIPAAVRRPHNCCPGCRRPMLRGRKTCRPHLGPMGVRRPGPTTHRQAGYSWPALSR